MDLLSVLGIQLLGILNVSFEMLNNFWLNTVLTVVWYSSPHIFGFFWFAVLCRVELSSVDVLAFCVLLRAFQAQPGVVQGISCWCCASVTAFTCFWSVQFHLKCRIHCWSSHWWICRWSSWWLSCGCCVDCLYFSAELWLVALIFLSYVCVSVFLDLLYLIMYGLVLLHLVCLWY